MPNTHNHDHKGERACARCGGSMEGKRPQAVYCSATCRKLASARRRYHADPETARAKARVRGARWRAKRAAEAAKLATDCHRVLAAIAALLNKVTST